MCFFSEKRKLNKERLENECNSLLAEINVAIGAANSYLANPNAFVDVSAADVWLKKYNYLIPKSSKEKTHCYRKCSQGKELLKRAGIEVEFLDSTDI